MTVKKLRSESAIASGARACCVALHSEVPTVDTPNGPVQGGKAENSGQKKNQKTKVRVKAETNEGSAARRGRGEAHEAHAI